jgi:hypothetical protein
VTILNPAGDDINIPDGPIIIIPDLGNSTIDITIPFNITNGGVYELSDIFLRFQLDMAFGNTSTINNATSTVRVFDETQNFGSVLPEQTLKANFSGSGTLPLTEVDWYRTPHPLQFYASLIFRASYSLNLYTFTVAIVNVSLGGFP